MISKYAQKWSPKTSKMRHEISPLSRIKNAPEFDQKWSQKELPNETSNLTWRGGIRSQKTTLGQDPQNRPFWTKKAPQMTPFWTKKLPKWSRKSQQLTEKASRNWRDNQFSQWFVMLCFWHFIIAFTGLTAQFTSQHSLAHSTADSAAQLTGQHATQVSSQHTSPHRTAQLTARLNVTVC